jgi:phosphoribosylformimino-5-aminoimidazole carboxamide ribotide isomerase
MTKFRPCIDLHAGKVKQIVGATLRDDPASGPVENFVAREGAAWFARKFRDDCLSGGHVIRLGPGNDEAAREALAAWPGGLQLGGGVEPRNAGAWLAAGASHVIVTSWLFDAEARFRAARLHEISAVTGPGRLVIDLSCRRVGAGWQVAMNRWQTLTDLPLTTGVLDELAGHCDEFLVHAADVEGLCRGIDRDLVELLGGWGRRPLTYAGGAASLDDVRLVGELSDGRVDVTVGSALDLFGGTGVRYEDLLAWNRRPRLFPDCQNERRSL